MDWQVLAVSKSAWSLNLEVSDFLTIVVPVPNDILHQLRDLLCTGQVVCKDAENAISLGTAADLLGIQNKDWKVDSRWDLKKLVVEDLMTEMDGDGMKDWRIKASEDLKNVTSEEYKIENGEDWMNRISDEWDIKHSIRRMSVALRPQQTEFFFRNSSACDICGKSYVSKGSLIAHKIFKHS